jgi:predicted transcriptional regulator
MFPTVLVSDELVAKLDEAFGRTPDASMTHREIDHWIGERRVVDCIKRWHAEQQEGLG